ncbi:MAG TPA: hypothetical protein VGG39_07310 [Polyangiaceae bacterium]
MTLEAPLLPCRGCGSPLAVDPSAAGAACGACRAVTPVPDELRRRAVDYARTLARERGRIAGARRPVEFEKVGLFFGPPMAVLIGGHIVAGMFLDADAMQYEPGVFAGGLVLLGVVFFAYIGFTVVRSMKEIAAPPKPVVVEAFVGAVGSRCSSCGGAVQFTVEQPNARCPFCGATVYPTASDQTALLAIAAERSDLEVARGNRSHARSMALSFDDGALAAATGWLRYLGFLLMPGILLLIGCSLLFQKGMPDPEALDGIETAGAFLCGAGLLLVALFVGVLLLVRALSRPRVIRRTLGELARAHGGGTVAGGLRPVFDWLDAHYAADVSGDLLTVGASDGGARIVRASVAFSAPPFGAPPGPGVPPAGRPAFAVVAHAPHVKRVDVFYALHRRRRPELAFASPAAHEVRSAGWSLVVTNGGVHMTRMDSDPRGFPPPTVQWLLERAAAVANA